MTSPLLIENAILLSTGGKPAVRTGQSVLIENGVISRVAPRARFRGFRGRRLDAGAGVAVPGLINAHTHFYSALALGLTRAMPSANFLEVLRNLWWRLDTALTLEDCRVSAELSLLESIRHGVTAVVDHHASPNAIEGSLETIAGAVRRAGLRACLCYEVTDRGGPGRARLGLEENSRFIRRCQDEGGSRLRALFGLHASFTLSDATLEEAASLGREFVSGFHIHVAEDALDQADARRRSQKTAVERLERAGILGGRSIAAHCVHVSPGDRTILAETGTAVVHNPQSNLNNAVGIADLAGLRARGALVGLGTDAMTANPLEELRAALWAQHHARRSPSAGFAEAAGALFEGNPEIARRIFGLRFGEIRPGFAGDLAIFRYDPPTPLGRENALAHALFGLSQSAVETTIVGGRVLMERRRLKVELDEPRVRARARELARKLWRRF